MTTVDKRVDAYIAKSADFAKPILAHVRAVVHSADKDIDEDIKWGMPWFTYKGKLVAYMASFKAHAGFGFYRGALVVGKGKEIGGAMGGFGRLSSIKDLPSKRELVAYVKKAVALSVAASVGKKATTRATKPEPKAPPALARALKADPVAAERWKAFAPSHRREYIAWVLDAKQDATRERRITTTIAWVRDGKPQNWRYEAKRR